MAVGFLGSCTDEHLWACLKCNEDQQQSWALFYSYSSVWIFMLTLSLPEGKMQTFSSVIDKKRGS